MTSWVELLCLATVGVSAWHPVLSGPLWVLLAFQHRPLVTSSAMLAVWCSNRRGRRGWWLSVLVLVSLKGSVGLRIHQRLTFYRQLLPILLQHPWLGHGFNPWMIGQMVQRYGLTLPSCHSDVLALWLHAGAVTVVPVSILLWRCWRRWQGATLAVGTALIFMMCVESVLERPMMAAVAAILVASTLVDPKETAHA